MTQSKKYGLMGSFKAKEGKAEELTSILIQASHLMKKAEGCDLYVVGRGKDNDQHIWVYEVWNSKVDHENSLHIQGVNELISRAIPLMEGKPKAGTEIDIEGGLGIDL